MDDKIVDEMLDTSRRPQDRLASFIRDIQQRFREVVDARHVLFYEEAREPVRRAYEELSGEQFEILPRLLERPEEFEYGYSFSFDPRDLAGAGLTGDQLEMKMTGYTHARSEFRRRGGVWLLKRLLRWINSLLGSMAGLPGLGPVVEPIKELKEALENMIEDTKGG